MAVDIFNPSDEDVHGVAESNEKIRSGLSSLFPTTPPPDWGEHYKDQQNYISSALSDFWSGKNIGNKLPVGPTPKEPDKIAVGQPQSATPIVDTADAAKRSQLWAWGLTNQSQSDMMQAMVAGREDDLRKSLATDQDQTKIENIAQQGFITPIQLNQARTPTDHRIWPERAVALKYIDSVKLGEEGNEYTFAASVLPQLDFDLRERATSVVAKMEIAQKALEEDRQANKSMGWTPYLARELRDFVIPGYGSYYLSGGLAGMTSRGQAYARYRDAFLQETDLSKAKTMLDATRKELGPWFSETFLENIIETSSQQKFLEDWFGRLDIIATPGIFKIPALAIGGAMYSMSKVAKALHVPGISPTITAAAATGAVERAGVKSAVQHTIKGLAFDASENPNHVLDTLQSAIDGRRDMQLASPLPSKLGNEVENRIYQSSKATLNSWFGKLKDIQNTLRADAPMALEKAMEKIHEGIKENALYKGVESTIVDISNAYLSPITNSWHYSIFVGNHDGRLFKTIDEAQAYNRMYRYKDGKINMFNFDPDSTDPAHWAKDVAINQQGYGYYIEVRMPLAENTNAMRQLRALAVEMEMPKGWSAESWASAFLNPDEFTTLTARARAQSVVHGPNLILQGALAERAKTIATMNRNPLLTGKQWKEDFKTMVRRAQSDFDPDGNRGYWAQSISELEHSWLGATGNLPDERQAAAYFALKDIFESGWAMLNMNEYSMKTARGVKLWHFTFNDPAKGLMNQASPKFNGVAVAKVPKGKKAAVFIKGMTPDTSKATSFHKINPRQADAMQKAIDDGHAKLIQLDNPDHDLLAGHGPVKAGDHIEYAFSTTMAQEELFPIQVPYRGGGNFIYEYPYYVVQPNIKSNRLTGALRYEGHNVIHAARGKAEGEDSAKYWDQARQLRKDGKTAEEKNFVGKHIGIGWKEWNKLYKSGRLSVEHPIRAIENNKDFIDTEHGKYIRDGIGKGGFVDGTKSGNPAKQYRQAFTEQRDNWGLHEVRNVGNNANPLFQYQPAQVLDPTQAAARAITKIANSRYMDSYKLASMEDWFAYALKKGALNYSEARIYASPYHFWNDSQVYAKSIDPKLKRQLETQRIAIKNFIGQPSSSEAFTRGVAQKLMSSVYNRLGPKAYDVAYKLLGDWELAGTRDPTRFFRSLAFHKSLGLFNPAMFALHAFTYMNAWAIAGARAGGAGAHGALLHFYSSFNKTPEVLAHMDKMASKFGWRLNEHSEAMAGLDRSGFLYEPGTFALHESDLGNEYIKSGFRTFLDWGLMFFKGGLKSMRTASWYAAYYELRHGGGGKTYDAIRGFDKAKGYLGAMDERHWALVQERANILSHNMSRSSSSTLNRGFAAMPLQFYTYFQRLTELMVGNRLTFAEQSRLFLTNMALYGMPTALGLFSVVPLTDKFKQYADWYAGYTPGGNVIADTFMNGLPMAMISAATGFHPDIAERYGPKAWLNQVLNEDKTVTNVLFGAVGSMFESAYAALDPFVEAMLSITPGSSLEPRWKVTSADYVRLLQETTTGNAAVNLYLAVKYGQLMTKSGKVMEANVTPFQSVLQGLTGLHSVEYGDMFIKIHAEDTVRQGQLMLMKGFIEHLDKQMRALRDNDIDLAEEEGRRARSYGDGLDSQYRQQAFRTARKRLTDQESNVNRSFYLNQTKKDNRQLRNQPGAE